MSQPLLLNLRNLACGYQDQRVVQNLNLHLNAGDIGCLLGSSGCGKTTTLRAIAGFEPVHEGEIQLAGETISSADLQLTMYIRWARNMPRPGTTWTHLNALALHVFQRPAWRRMCEIEGLDDWAPAGA